MLPCVKFAEDKVLVYVILRENAKLVQLLSLTLIITLLSIDPTNRSRIVTVLK